MSDERLRELERRWRASGALEDGSAYLAARVRAGELTPERLQIMGLLGDPAAREVWSRAGDLLLDRLAAAELAGVSPGALVAWRKQGLPCHRQSRRVFYDPTEILAFLESRLDDSQAWTTRPLRLLGNLIEVRDYEVALRALRAALQSVESTPGEWWDLASRLRLASAQLELAPAERDLAALTEARDGLVNGLTSQIEVAFADALRIFVDGLRHGPSIKPKIGAALEYLAARSAGEAAVLAAIRAEILPWLLGDSP